QVLGLTSVDEFVGRLEHDRREVVMLFRDLLIGVTSFFRDEQTFEVLDRMVVPRLFDGKDADDTIRIWVPGCATGEEAYSLAILLREHADGLNDNAPRIQIFATDIDEPAIATARAGRYPSTLLKGLSPERLSRFFVRGIDGSYTAAKQVRELCTFSAHSLTRDPPFSRIDLLSCRNLLIYLDADLQSAIIPAFHYSLAPGGILLLGTSETINRHAGLFSTLDRHHRIFQKRNVPSPPLHLSGKLSISDAQPVESGLPTNAGGAPTRKAHPANWAAARILEWFAPPFVVVTADGTSVQYSSRISQYLELPSGSPNQNVFAMARRGLRSPLRAALGEAINTGRTVERTGVSVATAEGRTQRIKVLVEPRREPGGDALFLVVFVETMQGRQEAAAPAAAEPHPDAGSERHLEAELRDTREQLQAITEEHDTALEELRSANEELHSVNEELQSTNEELETSKEEIQSINEELQTANGQLASKVDELDSRNSDLKNLFDSTHVATIFLDPYMVVRSFTPAVASIYNLIPSDQGRPLTDIVGRLRYRGLRDDVREVLQTLEPLERRVVRDDGMTHYLMKILPYRTPDNTVDGAIVTFVDVTSIVQAEQHQRMLVDELNHRVKNMLTVVISMAAQTMRRSSSMEEFSKNYMGRIHALSAAYSLLSNEGWRTVSLGSLLLEELKPFLAPDRANIVLDGPEVLLESRAALALGMAIHELTTNAVKYGALSDAQGNVTVRWHVEQASDDDLLVLNWLESNGPAVAPPTHRGFGMTLIERGLKQDMSAQVEMEFAAEGVRATLRAPLQTRTATKVPKTSEA
ncbi:MAG TPA: CheR family methyltransferase, partial [Acetobacteraceae bacterium]|nr:CheR family methyltransferase [Acetobacteraceae bacterium]